MTRYELEIRPQPGLLVQFVGWLLRKVSEHEAHRAKFDMEKYRVMMKQDRENYQLAAARLRAARRLA